MTRPLQDAATRQQAIQPDASFAVSAPAGSGKTELLIQRTLCLLAKVEQPENILGITFTRKAANEMRERIIRALTEAQRGHPVASEHEQATRHLAEAALNQSDLLGWKLLENPNRLRFQTIDGLCRQLANQLCLETGIVLPPNMAEDSQALYEQAAEKILEFIDHRGPVGDALRLLVTHLDGNLQTLVGLIANLLSSRDSWLPIIVPGDIDQGYLQERVSALIEEALYSASEWLQPYASELEDLLDYACRHKKDATWLNPDLPMALPDTEPEDLLQWRAIRSFLITGKVNNAKCRSAKVDKRMGFPTESEHASKAEAKARKQDFAQLIEAMEQDEPCFRALDRIGMIPDPLANDSQAINQAIFTLLPVAAAAFNTLSQEVGETDFTAVTIAAIEALGQPDAPSPLALRLDYRIQHILVDEFQDTSRVQIDLLERLTAGWQSDDGRTLFIVGDGMQSIYKFRKADVSLFIKARQEGIGDVPLIPLDLTANFRSEQQIVHWVNQSFSHIFPQEDNLVQGQVAFKAAEAVNPNSNWQIDLKGFASAEQEAQAIAEDISIKLDQGEDDLAILVRSRGHLAAILPALRHRQIPWQAQGIDPLANRMAVMDVHSLTRALCVPADRVAWLAILRAPWAGLNMADLLGLCEWRPDAGDTRVFPSIWAALSSLAEHALAAGISKEGAAILARLASLLNNAFEKLATQPLRETIEWLWSALDGPTTLLEERDRKDVVDYLDLLEHLEQGGTIGDWEAFERRLRELFSQPDDQGDHGLKIMTIHNSKGLEFDHVYLPALNRTPKREDEPLLLWWRREYEDGSEGYLLAAKTNHQDKRSALANHQSLYAYLKLEDAERLQQEAARLFYVACTRAKKSLFLSATLGWDEKKETIKKPAGQSILSIVWDLYSEAFSQGYRPLEENDQTTPNILDSIRRLPVDRPLPELYGDDTKSVTNSKTASYRYSDNHRARISGELLHHSLMRIVREPIPQPSAELFRSDWLSGLSGSGFTAEQKQQILHSLEILLTNILADKQGQWILNSRHEQSAAEQEIDYLDAHGSVQRAVVDRTFVEQGKRWVVDYKSSAPAPDESLEDFMQRELEAYRPQLGLYLSLFDEKDKQAMLYFPAICRSISLDC